MKNLIKVNCKNCGLCCHFHVNVGKALNYKELSKDYFFSPHLCDILFYKNNSRYSIEKTCKHYLHKKCFIHGEESYYPATCALFPLVLAKDSSKQEQLYIDQNCPQWKEVVKSLENKNNIEELTEAVQQYLEHYPQDIYDVSDYKKSGYKLKKLEIELKNP
jgi:Fe-S-cluster containining protein